MIATGLVALLVCVHTHTRTLLSPASPHAGVILKLVGGTCGAMLIFLMPGALLVQYSLTKHRASRRQQPLREPLLPGGEAAAEAGDSGAHTPHGQQHVHATEAFSLWWSILFWTAIVLLLLGSFVALLAIITTIRPLS